MLFFVGNDGTIIKSDPAPVYQGAANANDIFIVAPFASNLSVGVAFKLPNGVWTDIFMLTPVGEIPQTVNKLTGAPYSGWKYSLPNEITKEYGTVKAQFYFYPAQGGIVTPTSYTSFEVGRGVPAQLPEEPQPDIYAQILAVLSQIQGDLKSGYFAARALIGWHSTPFVYGNGEFVYYPEKGKNGTFLQSIKADNTAPPYNEQGALNTDAWKEVVNFDYISEQFFNTIHDLVAEAEGYKEAAEKAQSGALTAKDEAQSAQTAAETARRGAETAQQGALDAKEAAETAQTEALKAKDEAQSAQSAAETAQNSAETANDRAQEAASKSEEILETIEDKLSKVYRYKGTVANYGDLPTDDNEVGDVYDVQNANGDYPPGTNYAWNGQTWDALGGMVDLSPINRAIADNAQNIENNRRSIESETKRATEKEKAIEQNLSLTSENINEQLQTLGENISKEAERAMGVEKDISQALTEETQRAQLAEQNNAGAIADETLRAEKAESDFSDKIVAETARAIAAEQTNARAVETEQARAEAAEQANAKGIETNAKAISDEAIRAKGVESGLANRVTAIETVIPSGASATDQLATRSFVNSSINALAAFYITYNADGAAFPSKAALFGAKAFYQGGKTRVPTQNDYAIVLADESKEKGVDGSYPTTRYSYQGGTYPAGQWDFQYIVNNTSLTQAQVDALNSGATAALIGQITTNKSDIAALKKKNTEQDNAIKTAQNKADSAVVTTAQSLTPEQKRIARENIGAGTPYVLPAATADMRGGIQVGYNQNGNNYPLKLDSITGRAYVTIPAARFDIDAAFLAAHPVKSLYWSDDPTSPATHGGTWEELPNGTFIMASGSGGTAGQTGGTSSVTLEIANLPEMKAYLEEDFLSKQNVSDFGENSRYLPQGVMDQYYNPNNSEESHWGWENGATQMYPAAVTRGSSKAFDIVPPYRSTHVWRRVA